MDDGHLAGELGEVGGLLHGRVAAADDDDLLVAEEEAVAGGAGGDAVAHQLSLAGDAAELGRGAGRDDQGVGAVGVLVGAEGEGALFEVDLDRPLELHLGAEAPGLLAHAVHQLGAEDPFGEAGEVLDVGGDGELAAGLAAFEHERSEVGPRGIERRREAGRARAEDDHPVVVVDVVLALLGTGHRGRSPPGSHR